MTSDTQTDNHPTNQPDNPAPQPCKHGLPSHCAICLGMRSSLEGLAFLWGSLEPLAGKAKTNAGPKNLQRDPSRRPPQEWTNYKRRIAHKRYSLSHTEEYRLARLMRAGDLQALERLKHSALPWAIKVVERFYLRHLGGHTRAGYEVFQWRTMEELMSAAQRVLNLRVPEFDPTVALGGPNQLLLSAFLQPHLDLELGNYARANNIEVAFKTVQELALEGNIDALLKRMLPKIRAKAYAYVSDFRGPKVDRSMLAEELVAEGALAVRNSLARYDPSRAYIWTFMDVVIHAAFVRYVERKGFRDGRELTVLDEAPWLVERYDAEHTEAGLEAFREAEVLGTKVAGKGTKAGDDLLDAIKARLSRLPKQQREIVEARYGLGPSADGWPRNGEKEAVAEISRRLGIAQNRVRQETSRVIENFRELFKDYGPIATRGGTIPRPAQQAKATKLETILRGLRAYLATCTPGHMMRTGDLKAVARAIVKPEMANYRTIERAIRQLVAERLIVSVERGIYRVAGPAPKRHQHNM